MHFWNLSIFFRIFENFESTMKCIYTPRIFMILTPCESWESQLLIGAILNFIRSIKVHFPNNSKLRLFLTSQKYRLFCRIFGTPNILNIVEKNQLYSEKSNIEISFALSSFFDFNPKYFHQKLWCY